MLRIEAALKMEARISRQHQQLKTQSQGLELAVLKPQKMGDPKKVYGCFFFLGRELRNSRTKKDETIFSPRKVDGMKFKRHFRSEIQTLGKQKVQLRIEQQDFGKRAKSNSGKSTFQVVPLEISIKMKDY